MRRRFEAADSQRGQSHGGGDPTEAAGYKTARVGDKKEKEVRYGNKNVE